MSFSFGFYNALNHDRLYDAIQVSEIFDGLIRDGVYSTIGDHYVVKASENENEVIVGSGRAWFDHTWNKNDADLPITAPLPDLLMKRYDALVIDINANVSSRTNAIIWVEGTPSLNTPIKPTLTNTTDHHQYPLCYILRTANNNTIIQDDIENTIGTDECPFVTGILQQVSISDLLLQWTSQFATFMNNNEATATAWENEWEASMNAWTVEQKNEFATWMAGEKTEFDDWFANLHYILDGDVAGHLQNEIDAIEEGLGGSVFTIHTINSSLYGKTVTCTGSTQEKTAVFDASGNAEIKGITDVGTITFTATDGSQTAVTQISVPYFSNYSITMAFWAATVNLSTTSEDLKNKTITIRKGGAVVASTSFNSAGTATYIATSAGTYTFTCQGYSVEQAITEETTYNVSINSGLELSAWITAGSTTEYPLNPSSYANFAALEADEAAIRQLMLVHDAVDYLATAGADDALIEDVINSDICAKWINLSDYALDTLYANSDIADVMDTADKYGYGEWGIIDSTTTPPTWGALGNVPIMTANNAPYGTVIRSSALRDNMEAWMAFDGNDATTWLPTMGNSHDWIGYTSVNPMCLKKVHIEWPAGENVTTSFIVQGSNDGFVSDIHDIQTIPYDQSVSAKDVEILNNNDFYMSHRLYSTSSIYPSAGVGININRLQFYGRELTTKDLIPKMTSATTPSGTITASAESYGSKVNLFDKNPSSYWQPNNAKVANTWIRYDFPEPVKVNGCKYTGYSEYKLQYLDGNNNWVDFYNFTASPTSYTILTDKVVVKNEEVEAKSWRLYEILQVNIAQYANELYLLHFGLDYSEKEFAPGSTRKTIYDHGVELETIETKTIGTGAVATKESNQLYISVPSSAGVQAVIGGQADFSSYSSLIAKVGNKFKGDSSFGYFVNLPVSSVTPPTGYVVVSDTNSVVSNIYPTLDISSVNSTNHAMLNAGHNASGTFKESTITELWLE